MRLSILFVFILLLVQEKAKTQTAKNYRITKTITYNNINADVVIDKPALDQVDVLLVFHGTVKFDSTILSAANNTLDKLDRKSTRLNSSHANTRMPSSA